MDFEQSKIVTFPNSLHTQCGTQEYVAPEVLENKPAYDVSCDMWAVGVIVFIMLGGYYPFRGKDESEKMKRARYGRFKFHDQYWNGISQEAMSLVRSMLTVDPDDRITAFDALQSPWIYSKSLVVSVIATRESEDILEMEEIERSHDLEVERREDRVNRMVQAMDSRSYSRRF